MKKSSSVPSEGEKVRNIAQNHQMSMSGLIEPEVDAAYLLIRLRNDSASATSSSCSSTTKANSSSHHAIYNDMHTNNKYEADEESVQVNEITFSNSSSSSSNSSAIRMIAEEEKDACWLRKKRKFRSILHIYAKTDQPFQKLIKCPSRNHVAQPISS